VASRIEAEPAEAAFVGDELDAVRVVSGVDPACRPLRVNVVSEGPPDARDASPSDRDRLGDVSRRGDARDMASGRSVQDRAVSDVLRGALRAAGAQRQTQ
jgi:hypothetical protein